ncbi:MAG: hypothetical protein MJE77_19585 [Proteobacteria bacterium]|nr:hypothetical protein [Pseudomonadota bacterium]
MLERVGELSQLREALQGLGIEEGPAWERLLTTLVENIGPHLMQHPSMLAQAIQQPQPIMVPTVMRQAQATTQTPTVQNPTVRAPRKPQPDNGHAVAAKEFAAAVQFMEQALNNETDPSVFAASARNVISGKILAAVRDHGVESFLMTIEKASPDSRLITTQYGKNWMRQVARALEL